jgi:hypothetical protein
MLLTVRQTDKHVVLTKRPKVGCTETACNEYDVSVLTPFQYSNCVTAGSTDMDSHNNLCNNFRKCVKQGIYGITENTGASVYVEINSGLLLEGMDFCLNFGFHMDKIS